MAIVAVVVSMVAIIAVVAYVGSAAGVRYRTRAQTMPVGWPLAATDQVVLERPPEAARDLVLEVVAARGYTPRLVRSGQVIAAPHLVPAGPLGRLVFVWFHPSIGIEAERTRLVLEVQELFQPRRGHTAVPESGPPASRRVLDAVIEDLVAADLAP